MSQITTDAPAAAEPPERPPTPKRRRRTLWRVLIGLGIVVVVLVAVAVGWFVFGRDQAHQRSTDDVVEDLRRSGATSLDADGRPPFGVYSAVATGTEGVGVPGLDESLGPNAPVTVTHGDGGCFTYRVDFNTHHWRTWTFCPSDGATFALVNAVTSTTRNVPGIDFGSVNTYVCDTPVAYLWPDPEVGQVRSGSCTGTSDTIGGLTSDAGQVEVLDLDTVTIDGTDLPAVHLRSTDTFGDAQTGTEVDEWWLDARTGLPLRLAIDANVQSDTPVGKADYTEKGQLELTTLTPTT